MLVVLGAAESGVGAAILAQQKGFDVFVSDKGTIKETYLADLERYRIPYESGQHSLEYLLKAELVVKSPGIPEKSEVIKALRQKNITIVSEIEFAARYTPTPIIAITGSNGKTTTTALCYHILSNGGGLNVRMAGNIGDSFARMVAMEKEQHNLDFYVLEVSSFQLDDLQLFRPHIAVITNITPDHLDRYEYNFDKYRQAKFNITHKQNQTDYLIVFDSPSINEYIETYPTQATLVRYTFSDKTASLALGAQSSPISDNLILTTRSGERVEMDSSRFSLKGKHNLQNCMAASIVAHLAGVENKKIFDCLQNFKGIEHRLETVADIDGIVFINDSKATNIDSTWFALDAMDKPVVWIVGGLDKGNDYSILLPLVQAKVRAIVCLGIDNKKIHEAFDSLALPIFDTQSAKEAVTVAQKTAQKGDGVLLSPACASFDLFKNYEDRGRQFKDQVIALIKEREKNKIGFSL